MVTAIKKPRVGFQVLLLSTAITRVRGALQGAGFRVVDGGDPHDRDDEVVTAHDLDVLRESDAVVLPLPTSRYPRLLASYAASIGKQVVVLTGPHGQGCTIDNTTFALSINEMIAALDRNVERLPPCPYSPRDMEEFNTTFSPEDPL